MHLSVSILGDMSRCVQRLKALSFPILGHLYVILHYSFFELEAGETPPPDITLLYFQDNASVCMNCGDMSCCAQRLNALSFPILGHLYVILYITVPLNYKLVKRNPNKIDY